MTFDNYLRQAVKLLEAKSILTARLDVLVLSEHVLGTDRAKLLAQPELEITEKQKNVLDHLLVMRSDHIPVAQLVGETEFYGRMFYVNGSVLEPRPESETMIDMLLWLVNENSAVTKRAVKKAGSNDPNLLRIADVGTGSGNLGITAKLELKNSLVDLIDVDPEALKVAKKNVAKHTIAINVINSDLLDETASSYDILLCNLPYVPDTMKINKAAEHEPKIAIFGGHDGLDVYRELFSRLQKIHHRPLYILTETFPASHQHLADIAKQSGYVLRKEEDFIQLFESIETYRP